MRGSVGVKILYLVLFLSVLFVYTGCSQLSLFDLVESEQDGEFSLGVDSVYLKVDAQFSFKPFGGYLPYTFALIDGVDAGTINSATGAYIAPGTAGETTIESRDGIGHRDRAHVFVYDPVAAVPATFTIRVDDDIEIVISGGIGQLTASAERGVINPPGTVDPGGSVTYSPPGSVGTDYIEILDEKENSLTVRVDVLPASGTVDLEIFPAYAVISPGASQEFTITKPTGHDLSIALSDSFGEIETVSGGETSAIIKYTAPGTEGAVFLTVTDDDTGVMLQADIYVQGDNTPLEITPGTLQVSPGTTVEFTSSGGVPPYVFSQVNGTGTLVQTSPTTANYTPTSVISMIRVTDRVDNQAKVKIQVK